MEPRPPSRGRAWRSTLLVVLALVALWGVAGGFLLPMVAKRMIAKEGGARLGRPVSVERVSVNPYTLEAAVEGFRVLEADGTTPFVTFERLDLDASAASFYRLAPVIDRLTLTGLKARLVRDAGNHYNVTDIVERLAAASKAHAEEARARREEPEEPARFSVANVRLVNAAVDFDDRPVGRRHQVSEIHVSIPFISNLPGHLKEYVQPSLAAKVNGAPLLVTGETQPFEDTLRTHFTLDLNALEIPRYLAYVPAPIPVRVDSGVLDAHVTVRFTQGRAGKQPSIEAAGVAALTDMALSGANGEMLRTGRLEVRLGSFDVLGGKARVEEVRFGDVRGLEGDLRIAEAVASGIDLDLRQRSARIAQVTTRDGALGLKRASDGTFALPQFRAAAADAPAGTPAPAWKVAIDRATLAGYQVTLVDAGVRPAVTHRVKVTSVEATDLANQDGFRGKAAARLALEHGGSLEVDSTFALEPLQVAAKIDARGVDLVPLRPYMNQFATVALKSGAASARGELTLKGGPRGVRVGYTGGAEIARFAAYDTTAREELLSFRSVRTSGIDFDWAPDAPIGVTVGDIVVNKVYSRLVVHPDGKLNLQQLRTATADEPDAPAQAVEPRPRNVRIDRIAFIDGRLNFTDHFIRPNYSADVGGLQGTVTGLSSAPESRGTVDLKGSYDGVSPVTIAGTVNPLRGDLFADIAAKGRDIELPRLTAYSERYAGYGIKEGRLTLDVKYHIEDGKLEGRNNITLDQLTFGDKVESPEATKLPVLFAVNLLKDADGRIALELPISGSLDDPQFDVGALVGQLLGSLLKKAVTSPFSLLAAAFGGSPGSPGAAGDASQDLAFVEFAPGHSDLDAADVRKLETMVRALQGRPGLTLEMAALLDPERDAEALRLEALQRMLAADGKTPEGDAYAAALRAAYAKAKLPGKPAELTPEAMEAALLEKIEVGETELDALKASRAEKVRAWLVEPGRLPAQRVVLAQARAEGAEAGANGTRVAFALR